MADDEIGSSDIGFGDCSASNSMKPITLTALFVFAACSAPEQPVDQHSPDDTVVENPSDGASISTDRQRYSFADGQHGREVTIRATFTAPGPDTVYLVNCNGAILTGLQAEVDGGWQDVWSTLTNQCLSEPIEVAPGEQHSDLMMIRRGAGTMLPRGDGTETPGSGTYRVVWRGVLTSTEGYPRGDELPLEQRVSAPFLIE